MYLCLQIDIDECEEEDQCGQGRCENLPGSFGCDCNEGYTATPDGRNCMGKKFDFRMSLSVFDFNKQVWIKLLCSWFNYFYCYAVTICYFAQIFK